MAWICHAKLTDINILSDLLSHSLIHACSLLCDRQWLHKGLKVLIHSWCIPSNIFCIKWRLWGEDHHWEVWVESSWMYPRIFNTLISLLIIWIFQLVKADWVSPLCITYFSMKPFVWYCKFPSWIQDISYESRVFKNVLHLHCIFTQEIFTWFWEFRHIKQEYKCLLINHREIYF